MASGGDRDPGAVPDLVKTSTPDVVLLDVTLRGVPARRLRRLPHLEGDAATRDVPVIMLSAHDKAGDVAGAAPPRRELSAEAVRTLELIDAIKKVIDVK